MAKTTPRRLRAVRVREAEKADRERIAELAADLSLDPDARRIEDDIRRKVSRLVVRIVGSPAPDVPTLEAAGRFGRQAAEAWLAVVDYDAAIGNLWGLADLLRETGGLPPTIKPGEAVRGHPEIAPLSPSRAGYLIRDAHRYTRPQAVESGTLPSRALRNGAGPGCYSAEDAREYLRLR